MSRWLKCVLARLILWAVEIWHAELERDAELPSADGSADYQTLTAAPSRSSRWPAVRLAHLLQHPRCELCGNESHLEVHHVEPFHLAPERELDPANLITLCEQSPALKGLNCHLFAGHLGSWSAINPRVRPFSLRVRSTLFGDAKPGVVDLGK
jgi:HNH endonuclease